MHINFLPKFPTVDQTGGRRSSGWKRRLRHALADPVGASHRALNGLRWKLYFELLNLVCDILFRWGNKLGIPGNVRARIYWKAGRREIVPLPQLYDFLKQKRPLGQFYSTAPQWSSRSQTIIKELAPYIGRDVSILEIGCNIGRNLNHLWQAGYKNLRGMEISGYSVMRLRAEYPCLAMVPIDIGPAEQAILHFADHSIAVIFTMAMLEQLHPDCRFLFDEIARVAEKYVLAIEPGSGHRSHMQYPWDIEQEFTAVGLVRIDRKPWNALWDGGLTPENEWEEAMRAYDAFLFKAS